MSFPAVIHFSFNGIKRNFFLLLDSVSLFFGVSGTGSPANEVHVTCLFLGLVHCIRLDNNS